jgi:hypothetical protein
VVKRNFSAHQSISEQITLLSSNLYARYTQTGCNIY